MHGTPPLDAEDGLPLAIDEWDGGEGAPAGCILPAGAQEFAAAAAQAGVNEMVRDCLRCGLPVLLRRYADGGQGTWKQDLHVAPCGRPCRNRLSSLSAEHGPTSCSACGEKHPRAPAVARAVQRRERREKRRQRR